ncbi:MAG: phospholipase [Burkholderiaceae bacterium]|nr:phospholipase [Burkholderiaceae bacterium]
MSAPRALWVLAGPRARQRLREHGLRAADVRAVAGAAGGPKGLVLNALDRFVFGHWLSEHAGPLHLLGASIGAWRMACACRRDADAALREMAQDYIEQRYEHQPGKPPKAAHVSAMFSQALQRRFGGREAEVLAHPGRRLHVFTSRGKGLLARQGRVRTPLGYLGAFAANLMHRRVMGTLLERVVFSDMRDALPLALREYPTHRVALNAENLAASILASCSIPFWLDAVHDIAGAPRGAYWDGGITDYHLHLDYTALNDGVVLIPHFQPTLVPGWLDKPFKARHRASARLDNVVLLVPRPEWISTLPRGKLPDRGDFKLYGDDADSRMRAWRIALAESERLADEFQQLVAAPSMHADALP